MPTLSAAPGTFSLTGGDVGAGSSFVGVYQFAETGASLTRSFDVDIGADGNLRLDRLQAGTSYFNDKGQPTAQMQQFWQRHCVAIEQAFASLRKSVDAIQTAYDAAAQASAAASQAQAVVETVNETAATLQTTVDQIQSGDFNFEAVTIGGNKFVNNDGELVRYEDL